MSAVKRFVHRVGLWLYRPFRPPSTRPDLTPHAVTVALAFVMMIAGVGVFSGVSPARALSVLPAFWFYVYGGLLMVGGTAWFAGLLANDWRLGLVLERFALLCLVPAVTLYVILASTTYLPDRILVLPIALPLAFAVAGLWRFTQIHLYIRRLHRAAR